MIPFHLYNGNPAEIRVCEHKLSVAISYSDPLHGKLRHATEWKFQGMRKNCPSMAILNSDLVHVTVHQPYKFQADTRNP